MQKTWAGHTELLLSSVCPVSLLNSISRYFPGQGAPSGLCGVLGPAAGEGNVVHRACVPVGPGTGETRLWVFPEELHSCTHGHAWFAEGTSAQLGRREEICEPDLAETMALGRYWRGQRVESWLVQGLTVSSCSWGGCGVSAQLWGHTGPQQAGLRDVELWPHPLGSQIQMPRISIILTHGHPSSSSSSL